MANIHYFAEVANIAGVHIKMDTSKGKVINVHIEDGKIIHFKAFAEGIVYTNLNEPTMITNPTNVRLNAYYYISMVNQNSDILVILKLKEHRKFKSYRNIFIGLEC